jgi:antitoxin MazE
MKVKVIRIGNSKGIRLSKEVLKEYEISDEVELIMEEGYIMIKPIREPRQGWEEAFAQMHANGDDELLMDDVFEDEDFEEWE